MHSQVERRMLIVAAAIGLSALSGTLVAQQKQLADAIAALQFKPAFEIGRVEFPSLDRSAQMVTLADAAEAARQRDEDEAIALLLLAA